jgi:hypothetical protein
VRASPPRNHMKKFVEIHCLVHSFVDVFVIDEVAEGVFCCILEKPLRDLIDEAGRFGYY